MESTNTVAQQWDTAVGYSCSTWKPRSRFCHIVFGSAELCFSLGLTQCVNGIMVKKLQSVLLSIKSITFLLKLAVFEDMKGKKKWNLSD